MLGTVAVIKLEVTKYEITRDTTDLEGLEKMLARWIFFPFINNWMRREIGKSIIRVALVVK